MRDPAQKVAWVRRQVLEMIVAAGKGHIGGSLSCTDILVVLYCGGILRVDAANPRGEGRDRLVFSKGHACKALYAMLAEKGFFPVEAAHLRPTGEHPGRPCGRPAPRGGGEHWVAESWARDRRGPGAWRQARRSRWVTPERDRRGTWWASTCR